MPEHELSNAQQQFDRYSRHTGWFVRCSCGWSTKAPLVKMATDDALIHLELDDD